MARNKPPAGIPIRLEAFFGDGLLVSKRHLPDFCILSPDAVIPSNPFVT